MRVDEVRLPNHPDKTAEVSSSVVRWFIGVIGTLTGLTFLLILLTLHRGFDWSDEGFVFTLLTNNRVSDGEVWGFQHLLHPLFSGLGESVLAFRVLRLIGYVALSILLCWIAKLTLNILGLSLRRSSWIIVLLIAQIGTFAAWSYPPRYLGYNELAAWISQATGALLLFVLLSSRASSAHRPRFPRVAVWGIVGVLIAMAFIAKFTAALLLFMLAIVIVFFVPSTRERLLSTAALAGGLLASIIVMLIAQVPVVDYSLNVLALLGDSSAQSASGYSIGSLLAIYMQSGSVTIAAIAVPAIIIALGLIVSKGWRKDTLSPPTPLVASIEHVAFAFIVVLGLIMVLPRSESNWDTVGISNTLLFSVVVVGFSILARFPSPLSGPKPAITVTLALLLFALTPLVSGIGTNNPIFGQTMFSATLWAVGAAVMLSLFVERANAFSLLARIIPLIILSFFALTASLAVVGDVFVHPYRSAPYFEQTTEVTSGALEGLSLLPQDAALATWLDEAGTRHDAAGVPTISLATPGALLAFNASPWTNAWPGPDWAVSIERACTNEFPEGMFVLESGESAPGASAYDKAVTGLAACNISFPQDFAKVDERPDDNPWHNITIWKLSDDAEASR